MTRTTRFLIGVTVLSAVAASARAQGNGQGPPPGKPGINAPPPKASDVTVNCPEIVDFGTSVDVSVEFTRKSKKSINCVLYVSIVCPVAPPKSPEGDSKRFPVPVGAAPVGEPTTAGPITFPVPADFDFSSCFISVVLICRDGDGNITEVGGDDCEVTLVEPF